MAQDSEQKSAKLGVLGKYSYAWLTLTFFLVSFGLHWYFGWGAFVEESREHGQQPEVSSYLTQMARDTFENWQSEFLQLVWQIAGLAYFLYIGSPSSKENSDRLEAKVDELLKLQAGDKEGKALIDKLDRHYLREAGHAQPIKHD